MLGFSDIIHNRKIALVVFTGMLFGCVFAGSVRVQSQTAKPPNVILIMADDLGWAELGCYGQKIIKTPHLDQLAKEGMRFRQFSAGSPVCAPSRCSLMTGKHGGHAAIRDNGDPQGRPFNIERDQFPGQTPLPAAEYTLAEALKAQGYATGAVGKWGLGYEGSEGDPNKQGFDHFFGYLCQRHAHNHYPKFLWRNGKKIAIPGNTHGETGAHHAQELFTQEAITFLNDHRSEPFFLYLPFTIPHVSIQVPEAELAAYAGITPDPPFVNKSGVGYTSQPKPRAAYAAMVTMMDRAVGTILDRLRTLGLEENTIVLFTSDNGPTHDRVGGSDSVFFTSAGNLRGLKGSVYEGGIRVPLLVRWPGKIAPGTVSDQVGYFPDLFPTILDLVNRADAIPKTVDGLTLKPTLLSSPKDQHQHEYLFWDFRGYGGQQAVRQGDWKGVRRDIQKKRLTLELYNLAQDPQESRNVAADHPVIVKRLESLLIEGRTPAPLFPMPILDRLRNPTTKEENAP